MAAIHAPVPLLIEPALTPAARVLWLALQACQAPTPTRLAAASGLTLATVRKGLAQVEASRWYAPVLTATDRPAGRAPSISGPSLPEADRPSPPGPVVSIPVSLLAEAKLRPQAKLLYGLLQTVPGFRNKSGECTYAGLSGCASVSVVTARQAFQELAQAGWVRATQTNQSAPIRFSLRIPGLDRSRAEAADAERRLAECDFRGEAIMKEYLSLLIDSDEFQDNARPGFLVNPQTDERMELDRYYPPVVAFEFHGAQHFRTTSRFPSQDALVRQQTRDLLKEALCARRGIRVVVVTAADLNLKTMQQKAGARLPLRDLRGHEDLIQLLEKAGRAYQE